MHIQDSPTPPTTTSSFPWRLATSALTSLRRHRIVVNTTNNNNNNKTNNTMQSGTGDLVVVRATYLVHALLGVLNLLMWIWVFSWRGGIMDSKPPESFNLHPVLMTLAFTCFCEGALVIKKTGFDKVKVGKPFHATLHMVGLILASIGLWRVFRYHADANLSDMYSLHSWLGVLVFTFFIIQWMLGGAGFYREATPIATRVWFRPYHVVAGGWLISLMAATMLTGMMEKLTFTGACNPIVTNECRVANMYGICVALIMMTMNFILTFDSIKKGPLAQSSSNTSNNTAGLSSLPNETSALITSSPSVGVGDD